MAGILTEFVLIDFIIVIVIIRTYAIYERSRKIGLLLTATAVAIISIGVVSP